MEDDYSISRSVNKSKSLSQSHQLQAGESEGNGQSLCNLQAENKRLNEELKALSRNFEAICFKLKEDRNLLKRLEDELAHSKNKINKDDMEKTIQSYKIQLEQLASAHTTLEYKYKNSSQNCARYQANEVKYKVHISRLEGLLQQKEKNEAQTIQGKKNKEENIELLLTENRRVNEENKGMKERMEEMNKKVNETNAIYEKVRKENEMIFNLLEETRAKLKKNQELVEEFSLKMKNNPDKKYIKMYEEAKDTIHKLNSTIEILQEEIQYYKNLNMFNNAHNNKPLQAKPISSVIVNEISFEIPPSTVIHINKTDLQHSFTNQLTNYNTIITSHINTIESQHINKLSHLKSLIESLTQRYTNSLTSIKRKHDLSLFKIKETNDAKLTKKKKRKIMLKHEIKSLSELLMKYKEKERNYVDLSEIRTLFSQINEITSRLKLTMETFSLNLKCKNCFKEKTKVIQLSCGHSVCCDCLKDIKECFECSRYITSTKDLVENMSYNNILVRYKYAQQQIDGDIELVITTLKDYLKQK